MARRECADPPAQREYEHEPERDLVQQQHPIQPRRVIGQPHRGGYDCEFVERPSDPEAAIQCECPICLLVLREPHQIACCGYSYCEACIKRVQNDNNSCPSCNTTEFTTFPDKRLKRSLYAFRVYCSHRGSGCEWVGELLDLERHLNLQPPPEKLLLGCQFSEVHCTHCVHSFQRRYIQSHQVDDCLQRPFGCEHCNDFKSTYEEVTETHYKVCAYFPLSCPEHCGKYFMRHEIPAHVSRDCPLTIVLCDFHIVGCKVEIARKDLPTHVNDSLAGHMSLLQAHAMAYPGENIATLLPLFLGSFQKLIFDNVGIQSQLSMAVGELSKCREIIATQADTIASLHERFEKLENMCESKINDVKEHFVRKMAMTEEKHSTAITEHEEISRKALSEQTEEFDLECSMFRHELVSKLEQQERQLIVHRDIIHPMACNEFTFPDVAKHKNKDAMWYSPPFYTRPHGYRMCLKVYANGYGAGKGTHVSVFIYLMRGDFDDSLAWPCLETITVQLLNQLQDRIHCTYTITFSVNDLQSTSRVESGERAGSGLGNPTLISTDKLHLDVSGKCQYLKDNQLKFRVYRAEMTGQEHLGVICFENLITPQVYTQETPVEFTLSDFEQRKSEGAIWYSPAFYTHNRGYRICLQVYPNGYGDSNRTHVSVFLHILHGPFDAQLKWPFRAKITVQIVNQAGDDNHHETTINYNDQTPETSAGRVMDKERASSWGHGQFIPHTSLRHATASNTEYLRNDSLVIRVKIQLQ